MYMHAHVHVHVHVRIGPTPAQLVRGDDVERRPLVGGAERQGVI